MVWRDRMLVRSNEQNSSVVMMMKTKGARVQVARRSGQVNMASSRGSTGKRSITYLLRVLYVVVVSSEGGRGRSILEADGCGLGKVIKKAWEGNEP